MRDGVAARHRRPRMSLRSIRATNSIPVGRVGKGAQRRDLAFTSVVCVRAVPTRCGWARVSRVGKGAGIMLIVVVAPCSAPLPTLRADYHPRLRGDDKCGDFSGLGHFPPPVPPTGWDVLWLTAAAALGSLAAVRRIVPPPQRVSERRTGAKPARGAG